MNCDLKLKRSSDTVFQSLIVIAFSFRFEYLLKLCIVIDSSLETRKSSLLKRKTCQNAELATFNHLHIRVTSEPFPQTGNANQCGKNLIRGNLIFFYFSIYVTRIARTRCKLPMSCICPQGDPRNLRTKRESYLG